jgi:hypothetical protein
MDLGGCSGQKLHPTVRVNENADPFSRKLYTNTLDQNKHCFDFKDNPHTVSVLSWDSAHWNSKETTTLDVPSRPARANRPLLQPCERQGSGPLSANS